MSGPRVGCFRKNAHGTRSSATKPLSRGKGFGDRVTWLLPKRERVSAAEQETTAAAQESDQRCKTTKARRSGLAFVAPSGIEPLFKV